MILARAVAVKNTSGAAASDNTGHYVSVVGVVPIIHVNEAMIL
jgi:hypothetical protein